MPEAQEICDTQADSSERATIGFLVSFKLSAFNTVTAGYWVHSHQTEESCGELAKYTVHEQRNF